MKPIAIFRHTASEGPGYFATFLDRHSIPWQLIAIDRGETVPSDVSDFSGICLMGGPMSVNDPLLWITSLCALIRDAVAQDIPVLGHCLGGQLMSKALGGTVTRNPVKEIGWGEVRAEDNASAEHWLGELLRNKQGSTRSFTAFHWHGETFSLPANAQSILYNAYCPNQAFAIGPHLALQCHVEMTSEMITQWGQSWSNEIIGINPLPASIQTPQQMQSETAHRAPQMRCLADQLYSVWLKGIKGA